MRKRIGFGLTVVLPGVALVALAANAIHEEDALRARERVSRRRTLALRVRDALRADVLARAQSAHAELTSSAVLAPPPDVLYVGARLDLVAPTVAWSPETPDLASPPSWLRPLLVLEAQAPERASAALAQEPPERRASPAGLELAARLARRREAWGEALAHDAALTAKGDPAQRRVARGRRVEVLTRSGRVEEARQELALALHELVDSGGAGETPGGLWFALDGLLERARALGVAPIDSRALALRDLALRAAEVRAVGDPERAEGLLPLDARFRVARGHEGTWLVFGPLSEAGGGELRVVCAVPPERLAARLEAIGAEWAEEGDELALADAVAAEDAAAELGLGQWVVVRARRTAATQQLALRRGQLRLALIGGLVLLVVVGGSLTWRGLRRAAELARLRADFVASVTHELRTPLASIRANADVLALGKIPEDEQPEFLQAIASETRRLSRLVDDVLDASRIEQGAFRAEVQPGDLAQTTAQVVEALQPLAQDEGRALELEPPGALPTALFDPVLFPRALENLIVNALRYSGSERVQVSAKDTAAGLEVSVRDFGVGIPPAEHARLFERFVRGASSAGTTGTGLGLAISQQIARAQGGELSLESAPGAGACFTLVVPRYEAGS